MHLIMKTGKCSLPKYVREKTQKMGMTYIGEKKIKSNSRDKYMSGSALCQTFQEYFPFSLSHSKTIAGICSFSYHFLKTRN